MVRSQSCVKFAVAIVSICSAGMNAHGQFVLNPGSVDAACNGSHTFSWAFGGAAEALGPAGANWRYDLSSTAQVGGNKTLDLSYRHITPAPGCAAHGEGPNAAGLNASLTLARPLAGNRVRGGMTIVSHDGATGHQDALRYGVTLPAAGNGTITLKGDHTGATPAKWSYHPGNQAGGVLKVWASYPPDPSDPSLPTEVQVYQGSPIVPNNGGNLPQNNGRAPTDYRLRYEPPGSLTSLLTPLGASDTELAFLADVDGSAAMAPLSAGATSFVGDGEFFTPAIAAAVPGLFVAVDLTQWLTAPTPFSIGSTFSFANGASDSLPGFMASLTPITFNYASGEYQTDAPYTGDGEVIAGIDGSTPEPATIASLLLMGIASVARRGKRLLSH